MRKKNRSRASRKTSQKKTSPLSLAEKQVALTELGLNEQDLAPKSPTWAYLVGGGMILGAFVLAARLAQP